MSLITRFAPSPTGYLHLGHALSAWMGWHRAREAGGRFLLRIEDIDPGRCRAEFAAGILEDLAWLGLFWDGDVRVQSAHFSDYQVVLERLAGMGLLYPCFCTRAEIGRAVAAPHGPEWGPDGAPVYPGTCRGLSVGERAGRIAAGEKYALRLDMAAAWRPGLSYLEEGVGLVNCYPERFGDVVLARKDAPVSYHLCVTHDDALQGVTLVTRGVDLQAATYVHRLLQVLMGWPEPAYAHHRLMTDETGRRLAKRDRDLTLREMRLARVTPAELLGRFAGG